MKTENDGQTKNRWLGGIAVLATASLMAVLRHLANTGDVLAASVYVIAGAIAAAILIVVLVVLVRHLVSRYRVESCLGDVPRKWRAAVYTMIAMSKTPGAHSSDEIAVMRGLARNDVTIELPDTTPQTVALFRSGRAAITPLFDLPEATIRTVAARLKGKDAASFAAAHAFVMDNSQKESALYMGFSIATMTRSRPTEAQQKMLRKIGRAMRLSDSEVETVRASW